MGSLDSTTSGGGGGGGGSRTGATTRMEKRYHSGSSSGYSGSSGSELSSLEKRRRVLSDHQHQQSRRLRPGGGVSLKQARAAFANHSSNKEIWLLPTTTPVRNVRRQFSFGGGGCGFSRSAPPRRFIARCATAPPSPSCSSSLKPQHSQQQQDIPPQVIVVKQEKKEQRQEKKDENVPDLCGEQEEEEEDIMSKLILRDLQHEDPKIVARALERLGSIFKHDSPTFCYQAVHELNGHVAILKSLQKWGQFDKRVARHGCHTLFRMIGKYTKNPPPTPTEGPPQQQLDLNLVEVLLDMDAANVVIQVLQSFPRVCDIQLYGMGALGELFRGGGGTTTTTTSSSRDHAKKFVLEQQQQQGASSGISVIVQTMNRFPHHAKIQEFGCWLFARLCYCLEADGGDTGVDDINNSSSAPANEGGGGKRSNNDDKNDGDQDVTMIRRIIKDEALVAVATAVRNHPRHASIDKQAGSFMSKMFG